MIRHRIRIWHVAVLVLLIVAAFSAQLIVSIGVAHGSYRLTALQQQEKELKQDAQPIQERIAAKQSPQNLSAAAEKLGMISSGSPQFIDVTAGTVLGAAGTPGGAVGDNGSAVANAVLQQANQSGASGADSGTSSQPASTPQQASKKNSSHADASGTSRGKTPSTTAHGDSDQLPAATLR